MKTIKRLQKLFSEGKITAEEYVEQLKELLDDGIIKQEEYDGAKDFQPEGDDDKPIYSQADVDRMIVPKARKMIKKALTDAGVDLDGVENKDLLSTFANMALQGQKKGNLSVDEQQLNELQKKVKAYENLQPQLKNLTIENAVLKAAGKFKPINPKQVVRALDEYKEYLEYDEDDNLVPKSVEKALKKLAEAEPNLFRAADNQNNDSGGTGEGQNNNFSGKGPGGQAGGGNASSKEDKKYAANKARALEYLGLSKKEN
jgi:hypothetical protein